ncbi:MAG: DNA-binding protein WhiA [Clostridia bacterium]|nr:DNA-binding protein WhiA [Clostridia bacterium]
MSFSSDIKDKLAVTEHSCGECAMYELTGALMFGGSVDEENIKFTTENENAANRIAEDIASYFGIETDVQSMSKVVRIDIDDIYQVENIAGGISENGDIPFSCCRAAFVRGAFLGGGSVTDPQKGYHLEFDTKDEKQALRLMQFLEKDGFSSKITNRKGYYVVYIKGSEEIADILGYMGASQGAFELFSVQIEKEVRNDVNRRLNFENANADKAAMASSKHRVAIKKIKDAKKLDKLPDVLREIAELREEYPEDSLKELGEKTNPPIGKSGVNHRLNRILEIADNL